MQNEHSTPLCTHEIRRLRTYPVRFDFLSVVGCLRSPAVVHRSKLHVGCLWKVLEAEERQRSVMGGGETRSMHIHQLMRWPIYVTSRDEMSSVIRLDFSVGPLFVLTAHATLGEDTILARAATITAQIGASRVASIHTRRSAPVHAHVMVRALSAAPL